MTAPGMLLSSTVLFVGALCTAMPIAADWSARRIYDPLHDQSRCIAESDVVSLHDGYQETHLRLRVDQQSVAIVTESNIDGAKPDGGIVVDNQPLVPFDSITLEQTAIFKTHATLLIQQFRLGRQASVQLHFWPTWEAKGMKTVNVGLQGFSRAYARLPDCS